MKNRRPRYEESPTVLGIAILITILLVWAAIAPPEASGSEKTVTEGYYGTDRVKLLEKPVRAKSGETITYGYIGKNYVRIHSKPSKDGKTVTRRGWVDDRYVKTKEKDDG